MSNTGYKGMNDPAAAGSHFNAHSFLVWQILNTVRTATLVEIVNVSNADGLAPVGFVDVQPIVHQLDGHNNAVAHGVIHNVPYFRLQGGTDAVIIDPKQGDIGICIFSDRDISSVKNAKGAATPGSKRKFDMGDGLYIGGVLNGTPQQYIQFGGNGITVSSPAKITMVAPAVEIDGAVTINGSLSQGAGSNGGTANFAGPVSVTKDLTANGISVHDHTHSDAQGGTTGKPQ